MEFLVPLLVTMPTSYENLQGVLEAYPFAHELFCGAPLTWTKQILQYAF